MFHRMPKVLPKKPKPASRVEQTVRHYRLGSSREMRTAAEAGSRTLPKSAQTVASLFRRSAFPARSTINSSDRSLAFRFPLHSCRLSVEHLQEIASNAIGRHSWREASTVFSAKERFPARSKRSLCRQIVLASRHEC